MLGGEVAAGTQMLWTRWLKDGDGIGEIRAFVNELCCESSTEEYVGMECGEGSSGQCKEEDARDG